MWSCLLEKCLKRLIYYQKVIYSFSAIRLIDLLLQLLSHGIWDSCEVDLMHFLALNITTLNLKQILKQPFEVMTIDHIMLNVHTHTVDTEDTLAPRDWRLHLSRWLLMEPCCLWYQSAASLCPAPHYLFTATWALPAWCECLSAPL